MIAILVKNDEIFQAASDVTTRATIFHTERSPQKISPAESANPKQVPTKALRGKSSMKPLEITAEDKPEISPASVRAAIAIRWSLGLCVIATLLARWGYDPIFIERHNRKLLRHKIKPKSPVAHCVRISTPPPTSPFALP